MSCPKYVSLPLLAVFSLLVALPPVQAANTATKTKLQTKLKKAPTETVIYVKSLHCKTCAKKIARKLFAVKGVTKVRTDLKANLAIVTPQKKKQLDPLALWSAAKASGFPAIKLVGPAGTYLPNAETKAAEKQADTKTARKG